MGVTTGNCVLAEGPTESLDARAGILQEARCRGVADPKMRRQTEGRTVHASHAFRLQERGDEILVGLDGLAVRCRLAQGPCDRRIDIECALWRRAGNAIYLIEHADHQVTTPLEHGIVLFDEVVGAVQRGDGGGLADGGRVRNRLRLHLGHDFDDFLGPAGEADPPAGHAIGLRHSVHGQRPVVKLRRHLGDRLELEVVVNAVLINVVREHSYLGVFDQHIG